MLALARLKTFEQVECIGPCGMGDRNDRGNALFSVATWTCRMCMTVGLVPVVAMEGWCRLILFLAVCNFSWMMCGMILASQLVLTTGVHTARSDVLPAPVTLSKNIHA